MEAIFVPEMVTGTDPTRLPQALEALVGQDRLRSTGVGQALVADDQPVGHEPVDEPRHAALAEDDPVGQRVHAQPSFARFGEGEQRVVFAEG